MSFEFYQGITSENTSPRITVRKGGQLVLTSGAVAMLGDDIDHVQIGYDVKTKVIGIRGAGEDAQGRYRLRNQKTGGSRLVTGKRFFSHYGLTIDKARTFDAEAYDNGIVGFKLTEETAEAETETPAPAKVPAQKAPTKKAPTKKAPAKKAS